MTIELGNMSVVELQAAVAEGKAEFADVLAEMQRRADVATIAAKSAANGRTIKANASGGLFIRDPSFRCYSADKSKSYTGCLNVDPDLMRALVNDDELLGAIRDYLQTSGLTKFPNQTAPAAPAAEQTGNTGATVGAALTGRVRKPQ